MEEIKYVKDTRCYKISRVFPFDVNNHHTLFGGKLMSYIDDIASISAAKLCRATTVTASTDSVDFLYPIHMTDSVALESYVTWTGRSSMEIFVKVIAEDLRTGERRIAATSFLTFVALDDDGKPVHVPRVIPETKEEHLMFEGAEQRAEARKLRRSESKRFAEHLSTSSPWE